MNRLKTKTKTVYFKAAVCASNDLLTLRLSRIRDIIFHVRRQTQWSDMSGTGLSVSGSFSIARQGTAMIMQPWYASIAPRTLASRNNSRWMSRWEESFVVFFFSFLFCTIFPAQKIWTVWGRGGVGWGEGLVLKTEIRRSFLMLLLFAFSNLGRWVISRG